MDGQLGQRQRVSMLPEGHKACQTSAYKAAWRGSQKRTGLPPPTPSLSVSLPKGTVGKKLARGPTLRPCTG